ncbi:3-methyladenine DNA glycosylase [Oleiphilus sp. HI0009]|nr:MULTISPECIES: DNA-3-methyladenine glycosylase I [unclassified Oleiphilus]KZX72550.1 3-methyladenine DNA glycosylase [Oleiphilus sp. HI0009]KZY65258.1 3-methyladenine DNA glycosylase [Oleiphilus sp. HI0066]KZY68350.1 3-methyladenine DNA glycosylase [Oleiphilus sp. HI0067]MCH2158051.1 DNA-3-methyladenine glycosylase I [Oleiphilaceae bacterium]
MAKKDHKTMQRCGWCGDDPIYQHYHDTVWGRPVYDDQTLFEKLCLDGQQAGLSWITILKKQATYEAAYDGFDAKKIIQYDQAKRDALLNDPGIIRNKLKVESIIKNAKGFLEFEKEEQSFSEFLWAFVGGAPIQNTFNSLDEVPAETEESKAMSKALKKRGFTFVGPTICYAFMQAVGMVNDHLQACPCWEECRQESM